MDQRRRIDKRRTGPGGGIGRRRAAEQPWDRRRGSTTYNSAVIAHRPVLVGALVVVCSVCSAGVVPAIPAIPAAVPAALTVGTYATSYNAHAINHAIAAPYVAAAPLTYSAYPAYSAYSALPATAYSAPIIAGRR
ncbi:uncharacterized protein [Temnothorax longispinosus]|uniref:uncharacterized protein n=1 Tax=Temnothorax longispinosus TaxID=300112 RepID=UPI003A997857